MTEVLFDLGAEGRHSPVVNDVLEPGSLAVGAVAEVAKDLEDRLADLEHVAAIDVAKRQRQERKRLLCTRGRAQPAADQDVVADEPPVLDDAQKTEVVGMDVGAIVFGQARRPS